MRHYNANATSIGLHGSKHVLDPRKIGSTGRWYATEGAAVGIVCPVVRAPVLQTEWRIRDNHIEPPQSGPSEETRISESVTSDNPEVLQIMEKKVHSSDRCRGEVYLLTI